MGAAAMTPNMPMSVTADTGLAPRPAAVPQQGFAPAAVAPQNTVPAYSTGPQPPITQLNNPWLAPQAAAPAAILTPTNQFSPNVALPPAGAPPAAGAPSIAPPTSTALRPGLPPLGLDGFSPVTLCEKQIWQRGVEQFGAIHQGRLYLFTSAAEQQRFLDNPEKYSPVMSGNDPVVALDQRQNVPGTRQNGYFYNGRIYLFASEATQKQFKQNPTRYSAPALQAEAPRLPLR